MVDVNLCMFRSDVCQTRYVVSTTVPEEPIGLLKLLECVYMLKKGLSVNLVKSTDSVGIA